jgi:hypothetical protein
MSAPVIVPAPFRHQRPGRALEIAWLAASSASARTRSMRTCRYDRSASSNAIASPCPDAYAACVAFQAALGLREQVLDRRS